MFYMLNKSEYDKTINQENEAKKSTRNTYKHKVTHAADINIPSLKLYYIHRGPLKLKTKMH